MDNNRLIKVPLYTEREEVTDFDMYIYGTQNADEQKHDSFGNALKRYADDIGVNATELANLTGISKSEVTYYFRGERQVGFNTLIALCLALRTEYLSDCAYEEKFNLYACQMRLKECNLELLIYDKESIT